MRRPTLLTVSEGEGAGRGGGGKGRGEGGGKGEGRERGAEREGGCTKANNFLNPELTQNKRISQPTFLETCKYFFRNLVWINRSFDLRSFERNRGVEIQQ